MAPPVEIDKDALPDVALESQQRRYTSVIKLNSLVLEVRLGVTEQERAFAQKIKVDIEISFPYLPLAAETDLLEGTVCYGKIFESLRSFVVAKEFALIEHLCFEIHKEIELIAKNAFVNTKITKYPSVIKDFDGEASFEIKTFS